MARPVTVRSRSGGDSVVLVGEDGEVGELAFERLLKANPDWSVIADAPAVEPSAPASKPRARARKTEV